jgi:hypothetical protein
VIFSQRRDLRIHEPITAATYSVPANIVEGALTFACLHGLIRAVEKEAGRLSKIIATATSLVALGMIRRSGGQLSVGS